jgi:uncharacterized membrane protein
MPSRKRFITFIAVIQAILFLADSFLYETWTFSAEGADVLSGLGFRSAVGFLSVSFVAASILAFRYTNAAVRAFYRASAVWMGLLSFLLFGAVAAWMIFGIGTLAGLHLNFHRIVEILAVIALVLGIGGVFNASWTRITRETVQLVNLPAEWRGRRAALISTCISDRCATAVSCEGWSPRFWNKNRTRYSLPGTYLMALPLMRTTQQSP